MANEPKKDKREKMPRWLSSLKLGIAAEVIPALIVLLLYIVGTAATVFGMAIAAKIILTML